MAVGSDGSDESAPPLAVVVLAAGKGTRFPEVPAKVLAPLHGRALLLHVLDAVAGLSPSSVVVVVGHEKERVREAIAKSGVETVEQRQLLGTGHAVLQARGVVGDQPHRLLIVSGDVPLVRTETLRELLAALEPPAVRGALSTAQLEDGAAYGRILRSADGKVAAIVEARDATAEELRVTEINVGAYAFYGPELFEKLAATGSDNAQGECYLTDVVRALVAEGAQVAAVRLDDPQEGLGVNSAEDLARLEQAEPLS